MGKKSTEQLLEEASELGLTPDPEWSYSDLLDAVKEARMEPEEELTEKPSDPSEAQPKEEIVSPPGSSRRNFPFDELGRYIGR